MPPGVRAVHWPRKSLQALLLSLPLMASGCGAGVAGLILGILDLSSSDSSNSPPLVSDVRVTDTRVSPATISFKLTDAESDPADVSILFSAPGSGEAPVLIAGKDASLGRLPSSPTGTIHTRLWDFGRQLGSGFRQGIVVFVRLESGRSSSSGTLEIGNDAPRILFPKPGLTPVEDVVGIVDVPFIVSDSSEDLVSILAQYRIISGELSSLPLATFVDDSGWPLATAVGRSREDCRLCLQENRLAGCPDCFAITGVMAEKDGAHLRFFWDAVEDLDHLRFTVQLMFTPFDGILFGEPVLSDIFGVDNNGDPVVQIVDHAESRDSSFEVPIRFVVRDEESHPVSVILQWSRQNDPFPELPAELPADPGLLVSGAGDLSWNGMSILEWRRQLHLLSEAPVLIRGTVENPTGLPLSEDQVLLTDLVRKGLVFRPPGEDGPRELPGSPFGVDSDVFLIGRMIRFPGSGDPSKWRKIVGFDPGRSIVTLEEAIDPPPPPGTPYELRANAGLSRLASSPAGLVHSFVWDSLSDMEGFGIPLDTTLRIRAVGVDSQAGNPSPEAIFHLENSLFDLQDLPTEKGSQQVAVGDVDGDRRDDLVVVNSFSDQLRVYRYDGLLGEISVTPYLTAAVGPNPASVAVGDVNADGLEDIVLANKDANTIGIFHKSPDEKVLVRTFPDLAAGNAPTSVTLGDVDGDERKDVVVTNFGSNTLGVYLQSRDPPGLLLPRKDISTAEGPQSAAIGSLQADRLVAVACWKLSGNGAVNLFRVSGGTWSGASSLSGVEGPVSVAIGDIDGDERADIAFANKLSNSAVVFYQSPSGDFPGPPRKLRTRSTPVALAIGDIDGDGSQDVAVLNESSSILSAYLQTPEGLPEMPTQDLATGSYPGSMAMGDLNGDGGCDFAVGNFSTPNTVGVYLQSPAGTLNRTPQVFGAGTSPLSVAIGDVNGDGRNDVVVANSGSSSASIYLQSAGGALIKDLEDLPLGNNPRSIAIGDIDGDGRNDVLAANFRSGTVSLYVQDRRGKLVKHPVCPDLRVGDQPASICLGDLNGDGGNELVVANSGSNTAYVYVRDEYGGLIEGYELATGAQPKAAAVGDIDGDGSPDVVVANFASENMFVYRQDPLTGGLLEGLEFKTGNQPVQVAIGDLNEDGLNDILVADTLKGVFYQKDDNTLEPVERRLFVTEDAGVTSMGIGNIGGDGQNDVVLANGLTPKLNIYFDIFKVVEYPTFPNETLGTGSVPPSSVAIGDVNGDGKNDVAAAVSGSNAILIYLAR